VSFPRLTQKTNILSDSTAEIITYDARDSAAVKQLEKDSGMEALIFEEEIAPVFVYKSREGYGYGVAASRQLLKNTPIGAYLGVTKRRSKLTGKEQAYAFQAGSSNLSAPSYVLAHEVGSIVRFVNHSDTQNNVKEIKGEHGTIIYVTTKQIPEGGQLLIDYGPDYIFKNKCYLSVHHNAMTRAQHLIKYRDYYSFIVPLSEKIKKVFEIESHPATHLVLPLVAGSKSPAIETLPVLLGTVKEEETVLIHEKQPYITPLMLACANKDKDTLKTTLESKVDVFARTSENLSALQIASRVSGNTQDYLLFFDLVTQLKNEFLDPDKNNAGKRFEKYLKENIENEEMLRFYQEKFNLKILARPARSLKRKKISKSLTEVRSTESSEAKSLNSSFAFFKSNPSCPIEGQMDTPSTDQTPVLNCSSSSDLSSARTALPTCEVQPLIDQCSSMNGSGSSDLSSMTTAIPAWESLPPLTQTYWMNGSGSSDFSSLTPAIPTWEPLPPLTQTYWMNGSGSSDFSSVTPAIPAWEPLPPLTQTYWMNGSGSSDFSSVTPAISAWEPLPPLTQTYWMNGSGSSDFSSIPTAIPALVVQTSMPTEFSFESTTTSQLKGKRKKPETLNEMPTDDFFLEQKRVAAKTYPTKDETHYNQKAAFLDKENVRIILKAMDIPKFLSKKTMRSDLEFKDYFKERFFSHKSKVMLSRIKKELAGKFKVPTFACNDNKFFHLATSLRSVLDPRDTIFDVKAHCDHKRVLQLSDFSDLYYNAPSADTLKFVVLSLCCLPLFDHCDINGKFSNRALLYQFLILIGRIADQRMTLDKAMEDLSPESDFSPAFFTKQGQGAERRLAAQISSKHPCLASSSKPEDSSQLYGVSKGTTNPKLSSV